jgi:hypothetical protein
VRVYRAKIPVIARDIIEALVTAGDIELAAENREEAEKDIVAIMDEFVRRDMHLRNAVRDHMAERNIPYDQYGRSRSQIAEGMGHPLGEDVEKFLARQFVENLMISHFIDEVYEEDRVMYKRLLEVLRGHNVDERDIREQAKERVKNVREGTVDYEIALQKAVREEKKRRGLIAPRE